VSATASPPTPAAPALGAKPYAEAFCSPAGAEVFHSIVGPNEVWKDDPYDLWEIHAEVRETFSTLLNRAVGDPRPHKGRVLLLLGESGSGKTHLMRAFRAAAQCHGLGYCGYLQMTSAVSNYNRYVLSKLIDSLEQPYCDPDASTGLARLSTGLLEAVPSLSDGDRQRLWEGSLDDLHRCVFDLADRVVLEPRFRSCDLNLIRALLYLQRDDPRLKGRLLSYLRAEDLAAADRALLGGLVPRCREEDAQSLIFQLGRLMAAVHGAALVLLVDQLEDVFNVDDEGRRQFRRAVDVLTALGEAVPTSVVVIACLEQYFDANQGYLPRPKLDRLRTDPQPQCLGSQRDAEEVVALVHQRLLALYERQGLPVEGLPTALPFTAQQLAPLAGLSTREVLTHCLRHQQRCAQARQWIEPDWKADRPGPAGKGGGVPPDTTALEQLWNDFQASFTAAVPDGEARLAEVLRWAVEQVSHELTTGHHFGAEADGRLLPVEVHGPGNAVQPLLAAVCNKAAQGGALGRQISEVETRAGDIPVALVRSTAFPPAQRHTQVGKQLGALLKKGGRLVAVEDAEWRKVLALQQFQKQHGGRPDFQPWLRQGRPLSQLPCLQRLLALDRLARDGAAGAASPPEPSRGEGGGKGAVGPAPAPAPDRPPESGVLLVGDRTGLAGGAVTLDPEELKQHAAFLGATGSGKTTAALNLVEQLLLRGIPAVFVDRKGDLCRYADPAAWEEPLADPAAAERRRRLRERVEVALYTPGHAQGRPLTLPVVPEGTDRLPSAEREQLAGYAAAALGGMLNYTARSHRARLAILQKAIEVLAAIPGSAVTVAALYQLVESRDDALLTAVLGDFEDRQYRQLAQDLLALRISKRRLLEGEGERLDLDRLLGKGQARPSGRTPLSVISTRFLGDLPEVEFWVAQLLAALNRWAGRSPSGSLQAVVLLDEADLYLPAVRQPATKAPLEGLLRRARSAGLGVLLATQSPGDFDYKCRDNIRCWVVGQVKEETALRKIKPMFGEARLDPAARLPGQGTGEFHLLRGKEAVALRCRPSLLRTEQLPEERILELARSAKG
jgi:hypothetical protein